MEQTFLYEVRPHKIITGIHGVPYIRSPRSVYLTKEEVLMCLEKGHVYRRFANLDKLERVTINNVDRLHNETFIPEEEFTASKEEVKVEEAPKAEEQVVEEVVEPEKVEEVAEAPVEEALPEETVTEEAAAEEESVVEVEESKDEEEVTESVEETTEDESPEDASEKVEEPKETTQQIQFKSHHNKKHNKK